MAHHQSLHLENITVFSNAEFEFSPGINIFVGANGTGKTHVMKLLYSVWFDMHRQGDPGIEKVLQGVFQTKGSNEIIRQGMPSGVIKGKVENLLPWELTITPQPIAASFHFMRGMAIGIVRPVFIPSIDMMGHTRRFLTTYDEYQIDFDQTHRDIVALLLAPEKRTTGFGPEAILSLEKILGGEIVEESERFYLKTAQGRQPMPMVADGLRKIATLYQLMKNGWLQPGTVLFWDEPETHLSPILMDEVMAALLELARSGVQIFLSSHSYVILKELDLQANTTDDVRYFSFQPTPSGTKVFPTDDYAQLVDNPIAEQFDSIYDRELTRATGKRRK
jgi:energy-coupling factor transporter ATP-binding protein EcfA2